MGSTGEGSARVASTADGEKLRALGPNTRDATIELERVLAKELVPDSLRERLLPEITPVLSTWVNGEAAAVVNAIATRMADGAQPDTSSLTRWIKIHEGDAQSVIDCLKLDPPDDIKIIRLLSRAGSQKLVFLASWQTAQRDVVVKRFVGHEIEGLVMRESTSHPLRLRHENIIETFVMRNASGEPFLVERRLPQVLSDNWSSRGANESANLLRDIAAALSFLKSRDLVHGDIKPDNIGYEAGRYILLDFGICRTFEEFKGDASATGSLRTRAPELLDGNGDHGFASDIWALGATVFNAHLGRFPLFEQGEHPPRVSSPDDRSAYERVLAQRAHDEWSERVEQGLAKIEHDALRSILSAALSRDPQARISADAVLEECGKELAPFVRTASDGGRFSPADELAELARHFPPAPVLQVMSTARRRQFETLIARLESTPALERSQADQLTTLKRKLDPI